MREIKCWYCNMAIHPLDEFHHLWCHGNWSAYKEESYDDSKFKIVPLEPIEKQLDAFDDWCQGRGLTMSWTKLAIVLKRLITAAPEYQEPTKDE